MDVGCIHDSNNLSSQQYRICCICPLFLSILTKEMDLIVAKSFQLKDEIGLNVSFFNLFSAQNLQNSPQNIHDYVFQFMHN